MTNLQAAIFDLLGILDALKEDGTLNSVHTEIITSAIKTCDEVKYGFCTYLKSRGELPDEFLNEIIKMARTTAVHFLEIDDFNSGLE